MDARGLASCKQKKVNGVWNASVCDMLCKRVTGILVNLRQEDGVPSFGAPSSCRIILILWRMNGTIVKGT